MKTYLTRFSASTLLVLSMSACDCFELFDLVETEPTSESSSSQTSPPSLSLPQGVEVSFPEGKTVNVTKISTPAGELENGQRDLSGAYRLDVSRLAVGDSVVLGLPLNQKPEGVLKVMTAEGGRWVELPVLLQYRPENNALYFVYTRTADPFQTLQRTDVFLEKVIVVDEPFKKQSDTSALPGSAFRIHYFLPDSVDSARVVDDSVWGKKGGHHQDLGVPDFIEDLDAALNHSLKQLLQLKGSDGKILFQAPTSPLDVWIVERGSSSDASSLLGGPIQFLNRKEDEELTWEDMRLIASHELVHVLQGQHYSLWGLFSGRSNRWFIEATAQYYALWSNGVLDPQPRNFQPISAAKAIDWFTPILPTVGSSYLSVPIIDSNDGSMYSAGHFLQWLSTNVSDTIVADTILKGTYSNADSLNALLNTQAGKQGLAKTVWEYTQYLLTHPEFAPNRTFMLNMESYHGDFLKNHDPLLLNPNQLYASYSSPLASLSGLYAEVQMRDFKEPVLFVADPTDTLAVALPGTSDDLNALSYAGVNTSTSTGFASARPLENGPGFGKKILVLPVTGMGKPQALLKQLVMNVSFAGAIDQTILHYYLLRAPKVTVGEGFVTWDPQGMNQIPSKLLKAYRVMLGGEELGTVPYGRLRFEDNRIHVGDAVTVHIEDRHGNVFPEIPAAQPALALEVSFDDSRFNDKVKKGAATYLPYGITLNLSARIQGLKPEDISWKLVQAASLTEFGGDALLMSQGAQAILKIPVSADDNTLGFCVQASSSQDPSVSDKLCFLGMNPENFNAQGNFDPYQNSAPPD